MKVWTDAWVLKIGRRLIHPVGHFRFEFYDGTSEVVKMKVQGMNPACRRLTFEMVEEGDAFSFERETAITVVSENDVPRVFAASKIAEKILMQKIVCFVYILSTQLLTSLLNASYVVYLC